jgi:D-sedoheptulose 7-phosphate isomerase
MKNNIDKMYSDNISQFSKNYFDYLKSILDSIDISQIKVFVNLLLAARESSSRIFFIGNGGSASTASHFANDLSIGCKATTAFKAISLCDNQSIITAIANDFGYSQIFVRQLESLANEGDLLVAISASGNSENLVLALEYANKIKMKTCSLVAFTGGKMKEISQHYIHISTDIGEYGPAEDCHLIIDHLVSSYFIRLLKNGI